MVLEAQILLVFKESSSWPLPPSLLPSELQSAVKRHSGLLGNEECTMFLDKVVQCLTFLTITKIKEKLHHIYTLNMSNFSLFYWILGETLSAKLKPDRRDSVVKSLDHTF